MLNLFFLNFDLVQVYVYKNVLAFLEKNDEDLVPSDYRVMTFMVVAKITLDLVSHFSQVAS